MTEARRGLGVRVRVWGDYALFGRPEFKAEHVSYEVMTPSAARGILDSIHWKPAIRWVVDRIHVLRPIRLDTIRRNEVGGKLPYSSLRQAAEGGDDELVLYVDEDRQQRASLVLRDVEYVIDAHFDLTPRAGPDDNAGKHADMMRRRLERGQCMQQPCFGCREFPAYFEPFPAGQSPPVPEALKGERHLGHMLNDIDFSAGATPEFFPARLVDGVLDVPPLRFRNRP
jgi:CRISPR-associated protein Cas5d